MIGDINLDFWIKETLDIPIKSVVTKAESGRLILTLQSSVDSQSLITFNYRIPGDQSNGVVQDIDGNDLSTVNNFG